jgi:hypothetical protein
VARVGSGLATMAVAYCAFALARRMLLPRSRKAKRLK